MKKKDKQTLKAVIYTRISAGEPEMLIGVQINDCLRYCKSNNLEMVDCYIEIGSTVDGDRPQMEELLTQIRNKSIDAIVVSSFDRIHRDINSE